MPEEATRHSRIALFLLLAAAVPCVSFGLTFTFGTAKMPTLSIVITALITSIFLWLADKNSRTGSAKAITVVITAPIFLAGILAPYLGADIHYRNEYGRQHTCGANLKGIGNACWIYANDNNDIFPPDIATLVQRGLVTNDKLKCPYDKRKELLSSYSYISGLSAHDDADFILGYEDLTATGHGKGGDYTVLFADGHAEYQTEKEFEALMANMKQKLAEQGKHLVPTDFGWRIEPISEEPIPATTQPTTN